MQNVEILFYQLYNDTMYYLTFYLTCFKKRKFSAFKFSNLEIERINKIQDIKCDLKNKEKFFKKNVS